MFLVTVKISAKPGQGDKLAQLLQEMAAEGRKEPGMLAYDPYRSVEDPDTVFMYEVYRDQSALDGHRANVALEPFRERLMALLAGGPELNTWAPAG